jgi:UDP-glucose 4-epimerase
MAEVIITGASGFLGAAVLKQLQIIGVDCMGTSRNDHDGLYKVSSYSDSPRGKYLIHLAESNNRAEINNNELMSIDSVNTLKNLLRKNYKKIIYASSATLYGDKNLNLNRTSDPVYAIDMYTRTKLASEQLILKNGGAIARIGNLYGYGMSEHNVLSNIFSQLNCGHSIKLHSLNPVRDFLNVEDAARAVVSMMLQEDIRGIFNVGSGVGTSIYQLARLIMELSGSKQILEQLTEDKNISHLVLDISKTKELLGWEQGIHLRDGIERLLWGHNLLSKNNGDRHRR